ncbi:MAG: PhzF family phenazine biosynthesis protein [Myxococcota bacterium]|nr:PhzF family phenazine biosynthesis protein [Myxococcota bacterium]
MKITLMIIDAFTDKPFSGNPAAVCLMDEHKDETWMQHLAAEMNLSETAFVVPRASGFDLRWFTPKAEVDLCGHATLASAHALWETRLLNPDVAAAFHTKSGLLTVRQWGDRYQMDFPAEPAEASAPIAGVLQALGVDALWTGRNRMDLLIEVDCEDTVRNLKPDFGKLIDMGTRGAIVTAASDTKEYDFVSRFFCPGLGINEDPVTGSAHCCLGPYWQGKLGKSELKAIQLSKRRGIVGIHVQGDRVLLFGKAVTVLKGELSSNAT